MNPHNGFSFLQIEIKTWRVEISGSHRLANSRARILNPFAWLFYILPFISWHLPQAPCSVPGCEDEKDLLSDLMALRLAGKGHCLFLCGSLGSTCPARTFQSGCSLQISSNISPCSDRIWRQFSILIPRWLLPKASPGCDTTKCFPSLLVFSQKKHQEEMLHKNSFSTYKRWKCVYAAWGESELSGTSSPEAEPVTKLFPSCPASPSWPWQQQLRSVHHMMTALPVCACPLLGH